MTDLQIFDLSGILSSIYDEEKGNWKWALQGIPKENTRSIVQYILDQMKQTQEYCNAYALLVSERSELTEVVDRIIIDYIHGNPRSVNTIYLCEKMAECIIGSSPGEIYSDASTPLVASLREKGFGETDFPSFYSMIQAMNKWKSEQHWDPDFLKT